MISDAGKVGLGEINEISIAPGRKEVFILRFVDGNKEYLPDFR